MPSIFEAVISGHLAGQFTQTVLNIRVDPSGAADLWTLTLDVISSLIQPDELVDTFCQCLPQDWDGSSLRVRQISTPGPSGFASAAEWPNQNGYRTGNISSAQVNPVCIWIPTIEPNKTGRTFLPGISETDLEEMVFQGDYPGAVGGFMAKFAAGGSGALQSWAGVVYRRATNVGDLVQGGYLSPHIGTQRRRLTPV